MTPILLDTAVIIVILLSVIVSFFRGFVREMLTIVNLLGAAVAAWYLGGQFAPRFQKWMGAGQKAADSEKAHKIFGLVTPEVAGTFLSYFTVFFVTLVILGLADMAIAASVKAMGLGPLDKALGMAFGALRGFLLVLLVYVPFAYFMPPDKKKYPDWVEESMSFVALDASYKWLEKYTGDSKEAFADKTDSTAPDGPFGRRLKKMGDDILREQEHRQHNPAAEDAYQGADDIHREILSDDERHMLR
jgi:membrane protein required for colicin V production